MLRKESFRLAALAVSLCVFARADYAQTSSPALGQAAEGISIRPFKVQIPQAALDDLVDALPPHDGPIRKRSPMVARRAAGPAQELVRYWGRATTGGKWRPS